VVSAAVAQDLWRDRNHLMAVGTTSLRVLESYRRQYWPLVEGAAPSVLDHRGTTELYLYPGQEVLPLRGLWTNFHLPKSTLLMLLASIIPREKVLELYHFAIEKKYRFYSYGDACLFLL
jgi:S-adenosylmethionine:tRNA ribosyltransferase-isomerase